MVFTGIQHDHTFYYLDKLARNKWKDDPPIFTVYFKTNASPKISLDKCAYK